MHRAADLVGVLPATVVEDVVVADQDDLVGDLDLREEAQGAVASAPLAVDRVAGLEDLGRTLVEPLHVDPDAVELGGQQLLRGDLERDLLALDEDDDARLLGQLVASRLEPDGHVDDTRDRHQLVVVTVPDRHQPVVALLQGLRHRGVAHGCFLTRVGLSTGAPYRSCPYLATFVRALATSVQGWSGRHSPVVEAIVGTSVSRTCQPRRTRTSEIARAGRNTASPE